MSDEKKYRPIMPETPEDRAYHRGFEAGRSSMVHLIRAAEDLVEELRQKSQDRVKNTGQLFDLGLASAYEEAAGKIEDLFATTGGDRNEPERRA